MIVPRTKACEPLQREKTFTPRIVAGMNDISHLLIVDPALVVKLSGLLVGIAEGCPGTGLIRLDVCIIFVAPVPSCVVGDGLNGPKNVSQLQKSQKRL